MWPTGCLCVCVCVMLLTFGATEGNWLNFILLYKELMFLRSSLGNEYYKYIFISKGDNEKCWKKERFFSFLVFSLLLLR